MKAAVVFLTFLLFSNVNRADEALYGSAPPPDAAFFRILNISDEKITVAVGQEVEVEVEPLEVTDYGFGSATGLVISIGDKTIVDSPASEQRFTIVYSGPDHNTQVIEDMPFDNKRMALIKMYNFADAQPLQLKTVDGKIEILKAVPLNGSAERVIKAVKLATAVYIGNEKLANTEPLLLQKDNVTSIFAVPSPNGIVLIVKGAEQ